MHDPRPTNVSCQILGLLTADCRSTDVTTSLLKWPLTTPAAGLGDWQDVSTRAQLLLTPNTYKHALIVTRGALIQWLNTKKCKTTEFTFVELQS